MQQVTLLLVLRGVVPELLTVAVVHFGDKVFALAFERND
jgi:hypothetical protein